MEKYKATIGLEIHAELKTKSKMFCSCVNNPDEEKPNKNICPICMGHPGTLPILNKEAIKSVLKIGLAINGKNADFTEWDRKHYFYPDIPKGYQISQYAYPLITSGQLSGIKLERIHLEEDTAQSTHDTHQKSLVNFNRAGVPLMELVTKPVIHDAKTAVAFAKELQLLLRYLNAGEANMEKGEMRVEANISVSQSLQGQTLGQNINSADLAKLGTKTEVKNLNSFRAVERAIDYEIERQIKLLEKGEKVIQETRGWDDKNNETYSQRAKESSHDYRYFPDPDIPKLKISEIAEFSSQNLRKELPELPWLVRDKFKSIYNMTDKEVAVFVESPEITTYFESIITSFKSDPKKIKLATNYLLTDYIGLLKATQGRPAEAIPASSFAELIEMVANNEINSRGAKDLIALMIKDKTSPRILAEKNGFIQKNDVADIDPIIDKVITDNPKVVAEYRSGKVTSIQFLIGQAMKATKGSANPTILKDLLIKKLQ